MSLSYKPLLNDLIDKFNALKVSRNVELSSSITEEQLRDLERKARQESSELMSLVAEMKRVKRDIDSEMVKFNPLLQTVEPQMNMIFELTKVVHLLKLLQRVKEMSEKIEKNLNPKVSKQFETESRIWNCVDLLQSITSEYRQLSALISKEDPFLCYLKNVVTHWNTVLRGKLEPLFEISLKQVNWPIVSNQLNPPFVSNESLTSFTTCFTSFLKLELSSNIEAVEEVDEKNVVICLPMHLMLSHFHKRFVFHFMTNSRTNQLGKPEWYLTQVIKWIKDHDDFLCRNVDPIFASFNASEARKYANAKLQFTCGLLKLVESKLEKDLPDLVFDDKLFSHTFDEYLLFIREIEPIFSYNKSLLNTNCKLLKLFGGEQYFSKVMKLEKKKSVEFVENVLCSETAWCPLITTDSEEDEFKVPECADNFVLMLQSMTERFSYFSDGNHRCAFSDLLLELLDDFRLRLSQLKNVSPQEELLRWPFSQQFFSIVNTLDYLIIVLEEWKVLKIFLEMTEFLQDTVFDDSITCFKHMLREMQTKILTSLMNQVKVKMYHYANVKWFCYSECEDETDVALYDVLYFLSSSLEILHRNLSKPRSQEISIAVVEEVNKAVLEDVILKNSFNREGAKRLRNDVTTNMVSMFRIYVDNPENHIIELLEACALLNLESGTTILLLEALKINNEDVVNETLNELSIKVLSVDSASRVLRSKLMK